MKVRQDPSMKPYFKCLSCARFRKSCGGIPTRGMDLETWCEYMRDVKDLARLTNAYVAKEAEVSVKTIEWIMAINVDHDIMRATERRIELVVIGPVGDYACCLDYERGNDPEGINELYSENERLKAQLQQVDEQHRRDIRAVKEEYLEQIAFLKDELKAWRSLHQNSR